MKLRIKKLKIYLNFVNIVTRIRVQITHQNLWIKGKNHGIPTHTSDTLRELGSRARGETGPHQQGPVALPLSQASHVRILMTLTSGI